MDVPYETHSEYLVSRLDRTVFEIAFDITWYTLRVKKDHIGRYVQNVGELLDN